MPDTTPTTPAEDRVRCSCGFDPAAEKNHRPWCKTWPDNQPHPAVTVLESPDPAPGFEATVAGSPTPKAHQSTTPAPVDPALAQRVAEAIRNALKTRTLPPITDFTGRPLDGTGFGLTEYDLAEVVLAELAPELERAEQGRRQDERDEIETATALARSRAIRTMSCGHHTTSRCPDCNEIERGLRKQLSSTLENLGAAIAHDRQPYPTAWAYQQACTALGAQRERAEQAETALDNAYRERAHLVAWLAALHPSVITLATDIEEPGWQIVYITADGHQMSWHIHPRDADLFTRIERVGPDDPRAQWDGHSTAEKYHRIRRHTHALTPPAAPEDTP